MNNFPDLPLCGRQARLQPVQSGMLLRCIVVLLLWPVASRAQPVPQSYACAVTRAVDGDTFRAVCHNGIAPSADVAVRLFAVDAPETGEHAKCAAEREKGRAAANYLARLIPPGSFVELIKVDADSYGRWVAVVRKPKCNSAAECTYADIASELMWAGHARPWPVRSPKPGWCD